jgi:DNA mismatch repair protein MutS
MTEKTTMLDQYRRIKSRYRDVLLFFRLGDFYEMFFEDAIEASSLLDLTLTKRQGHPMCGIPYHAAKPYISRLLKAGRKVAICEQLSAPSSKGIVQRDVIEVVTPGTTVEEDFLEHGQNNFLASACLIGESLSFAFLDVSTGEFRACSYGDTLASRIEFLRAELYRLSPREFIVQQSLFDIPEMAGIVREIDGMLVERRPDWIFDAEKSSGDLKERFRLASLKGFGFDDSAPELAAAGVLLDYLDENSKTRSPHIRRLLPYDRNEFVSLDESTRKNLELVRNLSDSSRRDTLLSVIDKTKTSGGSRLLRQWILLPLRSSAAIGKRLDSVEFFYREQLLLGELRARLAGVLDTERLIARLAMNKAHAKDLSALGDSVDSSLGVISLLEQRKAPDLLSESPDPEGLRSCREAVELVKRAIREDPSVLLTEGNMMRDGFSAELDRLRDLKRGSTKVLESYLEEEKAASGIQNLRIRYNRIIGYYLEVSKGKIDAVPGHFIRRQSLVAGERYTTDRLADLESEINGATEKIIDLEKELFLSLRETLKNYLEPMERLARRIAGIDCVASFSQAATEGGYSRPEICEEPILSIRQGRHPVVETCLPPGGFVPNDIELDAQGLGFALITGPNMAGKSTFLRQTALITLLAHIGCFVPAERVRIGLVDRIFCRVGAQDNLARGESTFLVEMHETAHILNTATKQSLVIMDEVGRGTGTLDGVSIAWAVSEHLLDRLECRTLFATHYHELTQLRHPHLENMSMAVMENAGDIVFLKRLVKGAAAGSYGLHVARLAGIPDEVLERARELQGKVADLETRLVTGEGRGAEPALAEAAKAEVKLADAVNAPSISVSVEARTAPPNAAFDLFPPEELALARLRGVNIDATTPLKALKLLSELRAILS